MWVGEESAQVLLADADAGVAAQLTFAE